MGKSSEKAKQSRIRCRVCSRVMGTVRDFEGRIFSLCIKCEKDLKAKKEAGN